MTIQFNYVKKIDGKGNKRINLALPYDAYTVATHRRRSGPRQHDRHGRRRVLRVYSVPRTLPDVRPESSSASCSSPATRGSNKYDAIRQ